MTPTSDPLHNPRICVSFFASSRVPKDRLASWPQVWARGPTQWEELELTPQTRRLTCLLALRPAGYSAGEVGRALGGGVQSKGAAQNAASRLGEALEQVGLRALFVRSAKGGRGAKPWALREVTTDVELAAAAVAEERWTDAAQLTRGGTAELVGIPCPIVKGDWRELPPLAARSLPPTSNGVLPFELYDSAEHSKRRVRAHRTDWQPAAATAPPAREPSTGARTPLWRPEVDEGVAEPEAAIAPRNQNLQDLLELTQGSLTLLLEPHAGEPRHTIAISTAAPPRELPRRRARMLRWAAAPATLLVIVAVATLAPSSDSGTVDPVVLTVDNLVARGLSMREDAQPVVLTSRPWVNCGPRGCNVPGTVRRTGDIYDGAICQIRGDTMTNGSGLNGAGADADNRSRMSSALYYGVRLGTGKIGFVSEVWVRERGGQALPTCGADFEPSRPRPPRTAAEAARDGPP